MRLIYRIMLRISLSILIVLTIWAGLFYFTIVDEVQEETDDVLEDYSAMLIQNFLAGEDMPTNDNGSNNTYYIKSISADSLSYAIKRGGFSSEKMFIAYKDETEPARILRQLFKDKHDNYFEVTVTTPTIDEGDLIDAIWNSIVILFFLLLLVVLIVSILAIRGGLRPLRNFLTWLNNNDMESSTLPIFDDSKITEIKELSAAITDFASRGKQAFEQQKMFIGNASHELQTPIAICQNHLELLLNSDLSEKQMMDVAECMKTLSRLSKLNKSLLLLSKIENGGFVEDEVNINHIVKSGASQISDIYANSNISLTITESANLSVKANEELIKTLILNLIKNSYYHNIKGGVVCVEIGSGFISIENSGSTAPLDTKKIFERFYQENPKEGSHGLGLSIAKSICRLYGYDINYSFANNRHKFKISLN